MRASMSMKFFTGLQDFLGLYDPSASPPLPSSSSAPIVALFASAGASIHPPASRKRSTTSINKEELGDERVSRCSHNRSVHFPHDDLLLVSGYHDAPRNAFSAPQVHEAESIVSAYESACKRLKIAPNSVVERQIACFHHVAGVRQECLSLKGQRLSLLHMECLEEIFKRVQFDTLDFEYTFIDDDAAVSLAEMLEFYDSTVKLNLSFNKQINIRGWQAIFRAIKNCQSLQLLNLRYTSLSERALPVLARTLRSQPSLTSLHLENVALSGKNLLLLVCALKMNTVLKELYLGDNNLQPADGATLYQLIVGNTSLQMIDLRNNHLQDCGLRHICDALKQKDTLQKSSLSALVLWNNRVTSASMEALASALKENNKLETLNIGSNNLSVEGITALKPALLVNSSLQRLGLQATNLDCQCAIVLAECLADNHVMVRVDLRDNAQIGSAGLLALHLAMKMNTSITLLNLDNSCANSGSAKVSAQVKEYHEQFRMYFDEIKAFCERNKQLALQKLSVHSDATGDEPGSRSSSDSESSSESADEDDAGAAKEVDLPSAKQATSSEVNSEEPMSEKPPVPGLLRSKSASSAPRKRAAWKITRSSSLTCTELVEDINERIVQMSRSLPSLDEAVDADVVPEKFEKKTVSLQSAAPPPKAELGKSPSLPLLPVMDLGNDSTVTIKKKPRRFSVSLSTLSDSTAEPRPIPARFKVQIVERVVALPANSKPAPVFQLLSAPSVSSSSSSSSSSTALEAPKTSDSSTASTSRTSAIGDATESDGSSDFLDDDFVVVPRDRHPKMMKRSASLEKIFSGDFEETPGNDTPTSESKKTSRNGQCSPDPGDGCASNSGHSKKKEPPDIGCSKANSLKDIENGIVVSQGSATQYVAKSGVPELSDGTDDVAASCTARFSGDSVAVIAERKAKSEPRAASCNPEGSRREDEALSDLSGAFESKCADGNREEVLEPPIAVADDLSVFSVSIVSAGREAAASSKGDAEVVASVATFACSAFERLPVSEASEMLAKVPRATTGVSASFASAVTPPVQTPVTAAAGAPLRTNNADGAVHRLIHPCELNLSDVRCPSEEEAVRRVVKDLVNFTAYEIGDEESYRNSPLKQLSPGSLSTPSPVRSLTQQRCSALETDDVVVRSVVRGLVRDVLVMERDALRTRRRQRLCNSVLSPDVC